jgi:hypothetical protein
MQGARRRPWWIPRPSRATPQTPLAEPTLRERTDRLLIGNKPNRVGSASTEGKSVSLAATRNTQTGSSVGEILRPSLFGADYEIVAHRGMMEPNR